MSLSALRYLLSAVEFAAEKHRDQRRKDVRSSPYINHPIEVAHVLARIGEVGDAATLVAAVLHDTVEDTETTLEEIEVHFGADISGIVQEVSDDKRLPKAERWRLQVEHAPGLSEPAKLVKIADKICNVRDVVHQPPATWSSERRLAYVLWTKDVVDGCRGVNAKLEAFYDELYATALRSVREESVPPHP